jgi:poly(3-hydroxybutyrate) depolymerase
MAKHGASSHTFSDPRPGPRREITVFTYRPASFHADGPVVIVMHGRNRNGSEYRDWWAAEAERRGFLVVAPNFAEAQYPHPHEYNYGAMVDADGHPRPREEWLWPVVDAIFGDARRRLGATRERYFLFGHSAGGQFVHRLATFAWSPGIERAIAANSGSYTMPLADIAYPHGLGGTGCGDRDLRALFSRPLLLLLGDADVDPGHDQLPREPDAMKQGPHRFARGHHYFDTACREAARLGVPLAWEIATAPGVAHSAEDMAPHAARHLFDPK